MKKINLIIYFIFIIFIGSLYYSNFKLNTQNSELIEELADYKQQVFILSNTNKDLTKVIDDQNSKIENFASDINKYESEILFLNNQINEYKSDLPDNFTIDLSDKDAIEWLKENSTSLHF